MSFSQVKTVTVKPSQVERRPTDRPCYSVQVFVWHARKHAQSCPARCARPPLPRAFMWGGGAPPPSATPTWLQRLRLPCESRSLAAQSPLGWPSQPRPGPDPRGTPLVTPLQPRPLGTLLGTPAWPGLPWDTPCNPSPTQSPPGHPSGRWLNHEPPQASPGSL